MQQPNVQDLMPRKDERVLEAQRWVNETYGRVSGYKKCSEDGITGKGTLNSLIMGLQHELGISPLAANFGNTTMAKVKELGSIGAGWSRKPNVVRIIQHGLWCKGYNGSYDIGTFNDRTVTSVLKLRGDMGLPANDRSAHGVVTAPILRAILNQDAYVTVNGGSEKVRRAQQWLNGKYWQKSAYTLGPCDGHYTRNVFKSFMVGLQYEMGVSGPNGRLGKGTQAALRNVRLEEGSSGTLVELFSAACVFNEPVPEGDVRVEQTRTFNGQLRSFVEAFQRFSVIDVTGKADFTTWLQLLSATGNPDRAVTGMDTWVEITPSRATWLTANGYRTAGRYLNNIAGEGNLDKNIKPDELRNMFAANMRVFPIHQEWGNGVEFFTWDEGYEQAKKAHDLAVGYGFHRGTVLYFTADYDATQPQIDSAIVPFFKGVQAGLAEKGGRYQFGVYGSRNLCSNVSEKTDARYSFISAISAGHSGNLAFPLPANWAFNQLRSINVNDGSGEFPIDRVAVRGSKGDRGQGSVGNGFIRMREFFDQVRTLRDAAVRYGKGDADQLTLGFLRHNEFGGARWDAALGAVDHGFVDYVHDQGISVSAEVINPVSEQPISTAGLAAAISSSTKQPATAGAKVTAADLGSWGVGALSLYGQWRHHSGQHADAAQFCGNTFAAKEPSAFDHSRLVAAADGYAIGRQLGDGTDLPTALETYYHSDRVLHRFETFVNDRFGGHTQTADAVRNLLTGDQDGTVAQVRAVHDHQSGDVTIFDGAAAGQFATGFATVLTQRVADEQKALDAHRKNHQKFLNT